MFTFSTGLYVGSGLVGFGVSWQFGAAYSWLAQKVDITGIVASLFGISCATGGMISVPVTSFLSKESPSSMIWVVLVMTIAHIVISVPMWVTAKRLKRREAYLELSDNIELKTTSS